MSLHYLLDIIDAHKESMSDKLYIDLCNDIKQKFQLESTLSDSDGSGGDRRRAHRLPQGGAPPHAASAMHAPHPTKGDRTKHRRIAVAASTTKLYPFAHLGVPKGTKDKPPGRTGLNPTRHPQHFFENSHSK